jgi:hypothetical protein
VGSVLLASSGSNIKRRNLPLVGRFEMFTVVTMNNAVFCKSEAKRRRAASPRSYRIQAHKRTYVCPHGVEVHARKWKLYAATQDSPLGLQLTTR